MSLPMFIKALFVIAPNWNQLTFSSTEMAKYIVMQSHSGMIPSS